LRFPYRSLAQGCARLCEVVQTCATLRSSSHKTLMCSAHSVSSSRYRQLRIIYFIACGVTAFIIIMTASSNSWLIVVDRFIASQTSLSVVATVLSTTVITVFILRMRTSSSAAGTIRRKASVSSAALEIIIESSVLYSVTGIIWIPFRMGLDRSTAFVSYGISHAFFCSMVVSRFSAFIVRND
jgi:hypothetical protein